MAQRLRYALGLAGVLNLVVVGVSAAALVQERRHGEALAAVTTRNLCLALDTGVSEIVARADQALRTVKDHFEGALAEGAVDEAALERLIEQQHRLLRNVESLRIALASGEIRYGIGVRSSPGQVITDRAYYRLHRDERGAGLVVAEPVVGKISRKWVVILSRRLERPGGGFAGVVYSGVLVEALTRLFGSIDLGPKGVVALRDERMALLARYPDTAPSGNRVDGRTISNEMARLVAGGASTATYFSAGGPDGVPRVFTFRRLADAPLVLVVGVSAEAYLSQWWGSVRRAAVVVALSLAGSALALAALRRAAARERDAMLQLLARKGELEATLARTRRLEGIIEICMYCRRINNDNRSWDRIEEYLAENSDARFSHGMCPECYARHRDD